MWKGNVATKSSVIGDAVKQLKSAFDKLRLLNVRDPTFQHSFDRKQNKFRKPANEIKAKISDDPKAVG
jgi:hypothetical protein